MNMICINIEKNHNVTHASFLDLLSDKLAKLIDKTDVRGRYS